MSAIDAARRALAAFRKGWEGTDVPITNEDLRVHAEFMAGIQRGIIAEKGEHPFSRAELDAWEQIAREYAIDAPTNPSGDAVTASGPASSDDSIPSLVALDRDEAATARTKAWETVMGAALEWEYADAYPDSSAAMDVTEALDALRAAIRAYKALEATR